MNKFTCEFTSIMKNNFRFIDIDILKENLSLKPFDFYLKHIDNFYEKFMKMGNYCLFYKIVFFNFYKFFYYNNIIYNFIYTINYLYLLFLLKLKFIISTFLFK